jgi:hypothetical protein
VSEYKFKSGQRVRVVPKTLMVERIGQEGVVQDNHKAGTKTVTRVKFDKDGTVMGLYETSLELVGEALTTVEQYKQTVLQVALKWYKKAEWCVDDFREALGELGLSVPGWEFLRKAEIGTVLVRTVDDESFLILKSGDDAFQYLTTGYNYSTLYDLNELTSEIQQSEWRNVKTDEVITIGLPE